MEEIFKDVEDNPGYQVSNLGRIKSFKKGKERIIKPTVTKKGYHSVHLYYEPRKYKSYRVARLVYSTFNGEIPEDLDVDHIDNNKANNQLSNLQLLPRLENVRKDQAYTYLFIHDNGKKIFAESSRDANKKTGLSRRTIRENLNKKYKSWTIKRID